PPPTARDRAACSRSARTPRRATGTWPRRPRALRSWWPSVTAVRGRWLQALLRPFGGARYSRTTAATSAIGDADRRDREPWPEFAERTSRSPDRGGISVYHGSTSHQPPRQVRGIVRVKVPMPDIHSQLVAAKRRRRPVRLHRAGLDYRGEFSQGSSLGYVTGLSSLFVLLHEVSPEILLDGYRVLRLADITNVEVSYRSRSFIEKALALRGQVPSPLAGIDLSSVATVLLSASTLFPLVMIYRERSHRGACWVGQVSSLTTKTATLQKIGTNAAWYGEARYRLGSITRIEFGGRYEEALALVAGLHANKALHLTGAARRLSQGHSIPSPGR